MMSCKRLTLFALIGSAVFAAIGPRLVPADERTGKLAPLVNIEQSASSLAFSTDGKTLACDLVLRDLATGRQIESDQAGVVDATCTHIAFSPDGTRLASMHHDRRTGSLGAAFHSVYLWKVDSKNGLHMPTGLLIPEKPNALGPVEGVSLLTFSPDGCMLATRHPGEATIIWDTTSGKEKMRLDMKGLLVAFAPGGRALTSVTRDGLVQRWDLATGRCMGPKDNARRQEFFYVANAFPSADGGTVGLTDGRSIVVKDTRSGNTIRRFDNACPGSHALSPDGKMLAASGNTAGILCDLESGKVLARPSCLNWKANVLAFSPDGKSLAIGTSRFVSVWRVSTLLQSQAAQIEEESPSVPLEVKLTSLKEVYALALGGRTPEQYGREARTGIPLSPNVDLVLTFCNKGTHTLTINPPEESALDLYLVGQGAINYPEPECQIGFQFERREVVLAPGGSYSLPITSLYCGHCGRRSYWLLPGEYTLHASCLVSVKPHPRPKFKNPEGWDSCQVEAPPLRLKVVAENE